MADTPSSGPSGFPSQFPQAQGTSANLSLNTDSAAEALANLTKILDGMGKNLGTSWEKATKDGLAGQERFYKYIGDKESERRISLARYKQAALEGVNDELKAKLSSIDKIAQAEKLSQDDVSRKKATANTEAANQINKINSEASRKAKQDASLFNQFHTGVTAVGNRIGGPIGGMVSGVGNLIAEPEVAIPALILGAALKAMNSATAFTKTGAQLSGAGFGIGAGHQAGIAFDQRLFGGLNSAVSQDEQRAIIAGMAGSHTMIDQARTPGGMAGLRTNLGLFANILPDAAKEMEIFTDATKSLGMSQKDISKTFFDSRVNSKNLNITQLDAISTQLELQKSLRNITNDGTVAASVLNTVGGFFHDIGKSEAETKRMTLGVAGAASNLSLPQLAGMLSFTKGLSPTGSGMEQALFGKNGVGGMLGEKGSGVFELMGNFLSKVGGQGKNPMERLFMADSLNKQLGLGIQTQDLPHFFDLASRLGKSGPGGLSQTDFASQTAELAKHGKQLSIEGMDTLIKVVNPLVQLENFIDSFWPKVVMYLDKYVGTPKGPNITSQSLPSQNVKTKPNGGKHSSDFDVSIH